MDELYLRHNFSFKKKFGQNFLSDKNLLLSIAEDAGVGKETTVLEIGAGAGALTKVLCERAKRVVSFEIDKSLKPLLEETVGNFENLTLCFADFSKENFSTLEERLKGEYTLVANLPYYLTTPILMRFVEESKNCACLCIMVQEEVAQRICAKSGTGEYGALTAAIARRGSAKITRRVKKELFYPRPKVDSAVVKVDFQAGGFEVLSEKSFKDVLRCAFLNRRKTLENNLMSYFSLSRQGAQELLLEAKISPSLRGEALSPKELGALSDLLFEKNISCHAKS